MTELGDPTPAPEATVFVVDDDPGVRDAVRLLLKSVGLPSECFASGAAFLEAMDPNRPGCLILDLRMPEMSGMEVQQRLKAQGSALPIIFVTAQGEIATAVEAVKMGAMDFIQKPFQDEKLLALVYQALGMTRP